MSKVSELIDKIFNKSTLAGVAVGLIPGIIYVCVRILKKHKAMKFLKGSKFVGIELGGTNYKVAIGEPLLDQHGEIIDFNIIKSTDGRTFEDPQVAIQQINTFIIQNGVAEGKNPQTGNAYRFIGIASFGPICLDRKSVNYGSITTTPKKIWRNKPVYDIFSNQFHGTTVGIETDVNAAAFAEFKLGKHGVRDSLAYITVGTGVGVGVVVGGKTIHGLTHPEGGHIMVQRSKDEFQGFGGVCPYHKNCAQGMVCNLSVAQRLQINFTQLHTIADTHKIWRLLGFYLAQLCINITLLVSPEIIILGGGIMNRAILYTYIQEEFIKLLRKYVDIPLFEEDQIHKYIAKPGLRDVGVKGAMILAKMQQTE